MTATWTAPRTWETNDLVSANDLNQELRDNLEYLKSPVTALYNVNEASNYSTTSTSFVDVDGTDLALTIVTTGGDVMVGFCASFINSTADARTYFDIAVDGTRKAGDDGLAMGEAESANAMESVGFVYLIRGLSAGSHTFKLQWKVSAGTSTLYAGAGTSTADIHPQFWVREVS